MYRYLMIAALCCQTIVCSASDVTSHVDVSNAHIFTLIPQHDTPLTPGVPRVLKKDIIALAQLGKAPSCASATR